MSREILFRGKRREVGAFASEKICEWIYGGYVKDAINAYIYDITRSSRMVCVDPKTICQYTGLTDKNSRKIFEGDIVKVLYTDGDGDGEDVVKVKYSDKTASFCPFDWQYDCDGCCLYFHIKEVEVVGNIFDNPELLGE